jgi:hypothetical protein
MASGQMSLRSSGSMPTSFSRTDIEFIGDFDPLLAFWRVRPRPKGDFLAENLIRYLEKRDFPLRFYGPPIDVPATFASAFHAVLPRCWL